MEGVMPSPSKLKRNENLDKLINLKSHQSYFLKDLVIIPDRRLISLVKVTYEGGNKYEVLDEEGFPKLSGSIQKLTSNAPAEQASNIGPHGKAFISVIQTSYEERHNLFVKISYQGNTYTSYIDPMKYKQHDTAWSRVYDENSHWASIYAFTREEQNYVIGLVTGEVREYYKDEKGHN